MYCYLQFCAIPTATSLFYATPSFRSVNEPPKFVKWNFGAISISNEPPLLEWDFRFKTVPHETFKLIIVAEEFCVFCDS